MSSINWYYADRAIKFLSQSKLNIKSISKIHSLIKDDSYEGIKEIKTDVLIGQIDIDYLKEVIGVEVNVKFKHKELCADFLVCEIIVKW